VSDLIDNMLRLALGEGWTDAVVLTEGDKQKAKALLKTNKMALGKDDHARGMRAYWRAIASGRDGDYLLTQKGKVGEGAKHAKKLLKENVTEAKISNDDPQSPHYYKSWAKAKGTFAYLAGQIKVGDYQFSSNRPDNHNGIGLKHLKKLEKLGYIRIVPNKVIIGGGRTKIVRGESMWYLLKKPPVTESMDEADTALRKAERAHAAGTGTTQSLRRAQRRAGKAPRKYSKPGKEKLNVDKLKDELRRIPKPVRNAALAALKGEPDDGDYQIPKAETKALEKFLRKVGDAKFPWASVTRSGGHIEGYEMSNQRIYSPRWSVKMRRVGFITKRFKRHSELSVEGPGTWHFSPNRFFIEHSELCFSVLTEDYTATDLDNWWKESRPKLIKGGKATRLSRMNGCIKSLRALRDGGIKVSGMSHTDKNPVPRIERNKEDQPKDKTPGKVDEARAPASKFPKELLPIINAARERAGSKDRFSGFVGREAATTHSWAMKHVGKYKPNMIRHSGDYNLGIPAGTRQQGVKAERAFPWGRITAWNQHRADDYSDHVRIFIKGVGTISVDGSHWVNFDARRKAQHEAIEEMTMNLNDAIERFRSLDEANIPAPSASHELPGGGKQFSSKSRFNYYGGADTTYAGENASVKADPEAKAAMSHSSNVKGPVGPDGREKVDVRIEDIDTDDLIEMLEQIAEASDSLEEFAQLVETHLGFDDVVNALVQIEDVQSGELVLGKIYEHISNPGLQPHQPQPEDAMSEANRGVGIDDFKDRRQGWDADMAFAEGMMRGETTDAGLAGVQEANIQAPNPGASGPDGAQIASKSRFRKYYSGPGQTNTGDPAGKPADKEAMAPMSHSMGVSGPGYTADGREETDVRVEQRAAQMRGAQFQPRNDGQRPPEPATPSELDAFAASMSYPTDLIQK
jgi:hypothetical protein